ncbi:MAG: GNAT family N-acetyltransferase [Flaviflexus sp.]|nr:GNAT family N-acetyltransferase [Flaviflexus sp.]
MIRAEATKDDLPEIVDLYATTFAADPSVGWVVRRAKNPRALLAKVFTILLTEHYLPRGVIDTVRDDKGRLLGAASWEPPKVHVSASVNARLLAVLPSAGLAAADMLAYEYHLSKVKLPFPCWYLFTLAVSPEARGQGVGSMLLEHGIDRCGGDAIMLEASSTRSARLYRDKGFFALGASPSPGPHSEIVMWRPAADLPGAAQ